MKRPVSTSFTMFCAPKPRPAPITTPCTNFASGPSPASQSWSHIDAAIAVGVDWATAVITSFTGITLLSGEGALDAGEVLDDDAAQGGRLRMRIEPRPRGVREPPVGERRRVEATRERLSDRVRAAVPELLDDLEVPLDVRLEQRQVVRALEAERRGPHDQVRGVRVVHDGGPRGGLALRRGQGRARVRRGLLAGRRVVRSERRCDLRLA